MPEISLRNLTESDYQKVCQFSAEGHFTSDEDPDIGKRFKEVLEKKKCWVAELDGKPIGCVCLDPRNWIHISILPEFRQKGYGKQILNMIPVRGTTVWARIPNTNVPAIRLFRSARFTDYDFTKDFVIMQRKY